jgi:hypothetical protein
VPWKLITLVLVLAGAALAIAYMRRRSEAELEYQTYPTIPGEPYADGDHGAEDPGGEQFGATGGFERYPAHN